MMIVGTPLTVRAASPDESPLTGRSLLAERDGIPVAAIALASGSVVTNPFQPTLDAERLLKLTRYRILRQGGQAGAERALLRRATPGRR